MHSQVFSAFEHIVIDGGSKDGSIKVLERYEKEYNLSWISEPDNGIADAMNKGVKLSTGDYILFIHADDLLHSSYTLQKVYEDIKQSDCLIYSFQVEHNGIGNRSKVMNPPRLLWWNRFRNNIPHQGVFVHKDIFRGVGLFDTTYSICMDYDFFYRAFNSGATVKKINRIVSRMGGRGISSNHEMDKTRLKEGFKIQIKNEKNNMWKILQIIFSLIYFPYKLLLIPIFRNDRDAVKMVFSGRSGK